jgi:MYXO-CTERM domain-containing protein
MNAMKKALNALPFLFAAAFATGSARAEVLVRHPYIQQTTPTSTVVVWTTDVAAASQVEYGLTPDNLDKVAPSAAAVTQHEIAISGLAPSTRYYYRVGSAGNPLAGGDAEHYFETAPAAGTREKFRAWIVGDSGTGGSHQMAVRDAMLGFAGKYRPQLYLHMGDMAYSDGLTDEFTDNFFAPYASILQNTVCYATMGNHEGHNSDSGTQTGPYYTAYVLPTAGEAGGLPSGTEAYYSFDWANVHFVVLDSHDSPREPGGAMLTWMQADLAATAQEWIIAYWHHPPYTKGSHDSDTEGQLVDMRENALPILEAAGVDLVLAGHSHIYERSFLLDGAYDTPTTAAGHIKDPGDGKPLGTGPYKKQPGNIANDGAVYIVAGHGGASVSGSADHPVMYFSEVDYGSCLLDVQENRLSIVNVREDGELSDRFTIVKGTGLVVAAPDGGEKLAKSAPYEIQWATVGTIPTVTLEVSTDDGKTYSTIASAIPNTGKHTWNVPDVDTDTAIVRVSSASDAKVFDESNAGFIIGAGSVTTAIPLGSDWKYDDQGQDHGTAWLEPNFDDSAWASGPAQLGYGDGDEATVLLDASPNHPSAYFRKRFIVDAEVVKADLQVVHDDGVAVWVNGTPVFSKYMDNGTDYASFASAQSADNEVSMASVALSPNPFVIGENVVTAMVKQDDDTSSDISFDLALTLGLATSQGTGGSGAGGAGTGAGTGTGTGTGTGGAGGGPGDNPDDGGGCGCRTAQTEGSPAALLAFGLLGLFRFRRRRLQA